MQGNGYHGKEQDMGNVLVLSGFNEGQAGEREGLGAVKEVCSTTGHTMQVHLVRELDVHHCLGCFGCWVRTPGTCIIDDDCRQVARDFMRSDVVVFLTPISFGGFSGILKTVFDRTIPLGMPFFIRVGDETHHMQRYRKYPSFVGIGWLPAADPGMDEIFRNLIQRNALNFHSPASAATVLTASMDSDAILEAVRVPLAACGVS